MPSGEAGGPGDQLLALIGQKATLKLEWYPRHHSAKVRLVLEAVGDDPDHIGLVFGRFGELRQHVGARERIALELAAAF